MKCGRVGWQEAEATRKEFNIVLIHKDKKFFVSELFKVIQDAIPLILHYRTMSSFRTISSSTFITSDVQSILHSITNSGLIPGGQILSKRQTVFFTSVDLLNKEHRDPDNIDLNAPRLVWYKQKVWKKHQNTVYWVGIKLDRQKRLFYQTRSNAIILYDTLPAYCIPKAILMGFGEVIYEKVYASPRLPSKFSFKDNWMKELDSEVAGGGKDSQHKPNQRPKIQLSERWNLLCQSNNPVRVFRKSTMFLTWLRKHQWKNRETCFPVVCQCLLNV